MHLLNIFFFLRGGEGGLSDSRYSTRVMAKCDFYLKKRMKEIFAYVLELMSTLAKMQKISCFM